MNQLKQLIRFCNRGRIYLTILFVVASGVHVSAQQTVDSLLAKIDPQKWAAAVEKKADKLQEKLQQKTTRVLNKMEKQEQQVLHKLLSSPDSVQAKIQLASLHEKYEQMRAKIKSPMTQLKANGVYLPKLDSLQTALKFFNVSEKVGSLAPALNKVGDLQQRFNQAEVVGNFITERKEWLKQRLLALDMFRQLKAVSKQVYYYKAQVQEYKAMLSDSKKLEAKALELLSKSKLFSDFMKKNGQLASFFPVPVGSGSGTTAQSGFAALQTRMQLSTLLQQSGVNPNRLQQNISSAVAQVSPPPPSLQSFLPPSKPEIAMPDFKVNTQRTNRFLDRIEYGANFQSQKSTNFFPTTGDLGVSAGYKLNDNSVVGIGASYKLGLGSGWNNIRLSTQGVGLRSFIDWKIKGSFWLSGGYEQNFRNELRGLVLLPRAGMGSVLAEPWQKSGLIGLSKVLSIKSSFFKKTKIQLLWDFLANSQVPRTQPLLFRIGYSFN